MKEEKRNAGDKKTGNHLGAKRKIVVATAAAAE